VTNAYTVFVPGKPISKERPRFGKNGNVYTPRKTHNYEQLVKTYYRGPFFQGEVKIELIFVLPDRRRVDVDNLVKSVLDGLNGKAWTDDCQVVSLQADKFTGDEPGVTITIQEAEEERNA